MTNIKIKQAVILAGGQGTRLRPLTNDCPKPMILINDRPFLEYLIELLKNNGISEIILLLGYLPDKIINHFGDGRKYGLSIKYSVTNVNDETGTRLRKALPLLKDKYLLMYCDNYWPLDLKELIKFHDNHNVAATVTIHTNKDATTKNNVIVDENGYVIKYDKNRTERGLNGVDIGFFILNKDISSIMPSGNFSLEKKVIPKLIAQQQLAGYKTDHKYYSIGSLGRLTDTKKFLSPKKIIFLDRDGVINKKPPKADYVKKWEEFKFLPGAIKALKILNEKGFKIYIITNQPGIARKLMTKKDLNNIHKNLKKEVEKTGGHIAGIYPCLHGWEDNCDCRKPKAGLLFQAARNLCLDLTKTIFIGDDERDIKAGKTAGCKTMLIKSGDSLLNLVQQKICKNDK